jgi:hypothetical protein
VDKDSGSTTVQYRTSPDVERFIIICMLLFGARELVLVDLTEPGVLEPQFRSQKESGDRSTMDSFATEPVPAQNEPIHQCHTYSKINVTSLPTRKPVGTVRNSNPVLGSKRTRHIYSAIWSRGICRMTLHSSSQRTFFRTTRTKMTNSLAPDCI